MTRALPLGQRTVSMALSGAVMIMLPQTLKVRTPSEAAASGIAELAWLGCEGQGWGSGSGLGHRRARRVADVHHRQPRHEQLGAWSGLGLGLGLGFAGATWG
eukprot:scaffold55017_cov57-Phaeocystis_antarctica.AAC.2